MAVVHDRHLTQGVSRDERPFARGRGSAPGDVRAVRPVQHRPASPSAPSAPTTPRSSPPTATTPRSPATRTGTCPYPSSARAAIEDDRDVGDAPCRRAVVAAGGRPRRGADRRHLPRPRPPPARWPRSATRSRRPTTARATQSRPSARSSTACSRRSGVHRVERLGRPTEHAVDPPAGGARVHLRGHRPRGPR